MDPGTLALLIPVLALAIGFVAILKMPRRAFGQRSDPALSSRTEALEQEVTSLRKELAEVQERLDFAERLLTRPDEKRRVEGRAD